MKVKCYSEDPVYGRSGEETISADNEGMLISKYRVIHRFHDYCCRRNWTRCYLHCWGQRSADEGTSWIRPRRVDPQQSPKRKEKNQYDQQLKLFNTKCARGAIDVMCTEIDKKAKCIRHK